MTKLLLEFDTEDAGDMADYEACADAIGISGEGAEALQAAQTTQPAATVDPGKRRPGRPRRNAGDPTQPQQGAQTVIPPAAQPAAPAAFDPFAPVAAAVAQPAAPAVPTYNGQEITDAVLRGTLEAYMKKYSPDSAKVLFQRGGVANYQALTERKDLWQGFLEGMVNAIQSGTAIA